MKTLVPLLQSAPLVGPLGWFFGFVALAAILLLTRLWLSVSNKERIAMERELKEARKLLIKLRTEVHAMGLRNDELQMERRKDAEKHKLDLQKKDAAIDTLEEMLGKQSVLISGLTERCSRNEKLILKLYADIGKDIDLKHVGGEAPGTTEPPVGISE